ncbi:MAG: sigma-70 family RNA polymerase sigma factor [Longimicrobiales bacterium]
MEPLRDRSPGGCTLASNSGEITQLVESWSDGSDQAFDQLIELVYDDLRIIARRHLRVGAGDPVLNTTALVHEAYLKLVRVEDGVWESRAQFFAFCSKAMRRILIDFARRRNSKKRGGDRVRAPLRDDSAAVDTDAVELLAVEEALQRLEKHNQRMARIVECRFFGGMTVQDTAEALDTSVRTVEREWRRARVYLLEALG